MFDNAHVLELIERALQDDPFCHTCDSPTTIDDIDGRIWLVCSTTHAPRSLLARIGGAILPHERQLVVDLTEPLAA